MRTQLYLRTQTQLQTELETRLKDTNNQLASDTLYQAALIDSVRLWHDRVLSPHLYPFDFSAGVYEYALPSYVTTPFTVSIRQSVYGALMTGDDSTYTWIELAGEQVEPTSTGTFNLRTEMYPYSQSGRITYYVPNSVFPTTIPTVTTGIDSDDTSVTLTMTGGPEVGESGYVRIDNEYLSYSGVTRTSDTAYTLLNLVRGLYGSAAASHLSATSCTWCVAVDNQKLWVQLLWQATAFIHWFKIHKATGSEDGNRSEKAYGAAQAEADNFWAKHGYTPQRKVKQRLGVGAMGAMHW